MNLITSNPFVTLQKTWREGSKGQKALSIIGILLFITFGFTSLFRFDWYVERVGAISLGLAALVWFYLEGILNYKVQEKIEERIQKAEEAVEANPDKVRPMWDLARGRLELYFERNLSQIKAIFWVTVFVMLAGFILIGYGVYNAFIDSQFRAALLTTCAGVLTEFIAATFLVIYRSTMNQAKDYVGTLERINAVGMSFQVLDSIPESDGNKNKTRSDMVIKILDSFIKPINKGG